MKYVVMTLNNQFQLQDNQRLFTKDRLNAGMLVFQKFDRDCSENLMEVVPKI